MITKIHESIPNLIFGLASAIIGIGFMLGCGSGEKHQPVYATSGVVLVDGKPAEGARLFFIPIGSEKNPRALRPFAIAGSDGSFRLTSYIKEDGAPAGEYIVSISWPRKSNPGDDEGADRLRGQFSDPLKSKLRATVKAEITVIDTFQLKSAG